MQAFLIVLIVLAVLLTVLAMIKKPSSVYKNRPDQLNPMEGKRVRFVYNDQEPENADGARGHLENIGNVSLNRTLYDRVFKRIIDILLSFIGLVILSPVYLVLGLAIYIDDPGPVFFAQKRVGLNKRFFRLHKFRSMKKPAPHDVPTHMLGNADQYITRLGRFLRKTSLDELPQIYDIFLGNMSIIGPRPALWNQDLLTAEREKYGANDIKPGLTGWAQINGRDELDIPEKAKLDGYYVSNFGIDNQYALCTGAINTNDKNDLAQGFHASKRGYGNWIESKASMRKWITRWTQDNIEEKGSRINPTFMQRSYCRGARR